MRRARPFFSDLPRPPWKRALGTAILLVLLISAPLCAQEPGPGLWAQGEGRLLPMPLVRTEIYADVSGFVAAVQVSQIYTNPFDEVIEALYVFPLPERAAVDDFLMELGDRQIRGEIRRREEARAVYREARASGRTAALLEQQRPNIFSQAVANIVPRKEIVVHLHYVDLLPYEKGCYRFLFPTLVAARYSPATSSGDEGGNAAPGPNGSRPDPLATPAGMGVPVTSTDFYLDVTIDAGVPIRSLTSESHSIVVQREDDPARARVFLASEDRTPTGDFMLRIGVAGDAPEVGLLAHRLDHGGYFGLMIQPKAEVTAGEATPREILFVLDDSGSMAGPPIDLCKRFLRLALQGLGPQDRFNLVRFAAAAAVLAPAPLAATRDNVERGLRAVEEARGAGGTELWRGLAAALDQPADPGYIRIVFFLTDGLIGDDEEILRSLRQHRGAARIFTLGVGTSVNHYLLREMAALGRGAYEYIRPDGNEEAAVRSFQEKIRSPYLTDLEIDWGDLPLEGLQPAQLPDLFSGQNLTVVGRYRWGAAGDVTIRGRLGAEAWEKRVHVELPERSEDHYGLGSAWARERIRGLLLEQGRESRPEIVEEVTTLALSFNLVSPYTSYVAVDDLVAASAVGPATIRGLVVDNDGEPIQGVTVVLSRSGEASFAVVTDPGGSYQIGGAPPADDYVLVAELPGFAKIEVSPLRLAPGATTTQHISLVPSAAMTEAITVTGKGDIVDVASTKSATVFHSEFIDGLPILGRTYQDILTLAPGVTDTDADGNPNASGARETAFQTLVDGANATDPVTGTFGQNLNLESISEIEIITTGASAEFGQAQGGFANIITKSGGNEFEASLKVFFRSDLFDSDGANDNDQTNTSRSEGLDGLQDVHPFLTLAGPILRDRLWYFASLERVDQEVPVDTLTLPALATEEGWNNFYKVTWQANPAHRLAFQVNQDPRRFTGLGLGTGVAPESDYILDQGGLGSTVRWTFNISPSLLLETLVSRLHTRSDMLPTADAEACPLDDTGRCNPFAEDVYTLDTLQGTSHGPWFQTSRGNRSRGALRSDLSYFYDTSAGSHSIKTGFELAREGFTNELHTSRVRLDSLAVSGDRASGLISFQDAVPAGIPGSVVPNRNDDGVADLEGQAQVPALEATGDSYGLYVQESFKPRPNLTINVGVRYDREEAAADGYESFDPAGQAAEFLRLFEIGRGLPPGSTDYTSVWSLPGIQPVHDVNGDGLDSQHCGSYDLDGAVVGDGHPDGAIDDFFTYYDGDSDGIATAGDPDDQVIMVPDGIADGRSVNPSCDRLAADTFAMLAAFTRHQFDDTGEPFQRLVNPTSGRLGSDRKRETLSLVNNNLALRFSASWDPWADNRTKMFATWSRFYDKLFLGTLTPELGPDTRQTTYDASQQDDGSSAIPLQTGRFSITQVDREMKTPFTDELTVGFERELAPEWSLSFTYIARKGRDQLQDVDVNHFTTDLYALNPFFNNVLRVGNFGTSTFEAYQLALTRRLSRQWQLAGSYVFSKALGDAEAFQSGQGNDLGTVEDEFGPLSFDQTHVLKLNVVAFLAGDQSVGGTVQWASGLPFSLVRIRNSIDSFGSPGLRTTFPTGQRNDQRNEGTWLVNLSYRKSFEFGQASASVGVEVENLLNTGDLTITAVDQERFIGVSASRRFGRRWQLGAQFHF